MRTFSLFTLLGLLSLSTFGQTTQTSRKPAPAFRINAYAGYVFPDRFDSYYSYTSYFEGQVEGGFQWGLGLEYMPIPYQGIELSYLRLDAKAPTTYYDDMIIIDPIQYREFDVAFNYITLGTTRYFKPHPMFEPYIGVQVGMAIVSVSNNINGNSETGTKFAWGVKGGSNIWFSRAVGLKVQLNLNSITQAVGGGLYFGTGGVSTGLESYSTVYQFGLGGGLVFRLGGN